MDIYGTATASSVLNLTACGRARMRHCISGAAFSLDYSSLGMCGCLHLLTASLLTRIIRKVFMQQQQQEDQNKSIKDFVIKAVVIISLFFGVRLCFFAPSDPPEVDRIVNVGPSFFIIRFPPTASGYWEEIIISESVKEEPNENNETEAWATRAPVAYEGRNWDRYSYTLSQEERQQVQSVRRRWCQLPPDVPAVPPGEPFYDVAIICGFFNTAHYEIPADALPQDMQELIALFPPRTQQQTLPAESGAAPSVSPEGAGEQAADATFTPTLPVSQTRPITESEEPGTEPSAPAARETRSDENERNQPMMLDIPPVLAVALLIGIVWGPLLVIASGVSGWHHLARRYRWRGPPPAGVEPLVRGRVGIIRYASTLRVARHETGLFLGQLLPFRLGHPPLLIPWSAVQTVYQAADDPHHLQLVVDNTPAVPITLPTRLLEPVREQLPAVVEGSQEVDVGWGWLLALLGVMLFMVGWMWIFFFRTLWF